MENRGYMRVESLEDFLNIVEGGLRTVVYFGSDRCDVCAEDFPRFLDAVKGLNAGVIKVDLDLQKDISSQSLVFAVPTVLVFEGGREIFRESRFLDFNKIRRAVADQ